MNMIDLYNEITKKKEILYILNEAAKADTAEKKINKLRLVYSEIGLKEVLNHGINSRIEGVLEEIKSLEKMYK
jgi:hypothetical protein